jgi:hypothetical protein
VCLGFMVEVYSHVTDVVLFDATASKEGAVFEMKLYEIAILLLVFMLIVALQFVTAT